MTARFPSSYDGTRGARIELPSVRTEVLRGVLLAAAVGIGATCAVLQSRLTPPPLPHAPNVVAATMHAGTEAIAPPIIAVPDAGSALAPDPLAAFGPGECPDEMVRVEGDYCPDARENCRVWDESRRRCLHYDRPSVCGDAREPMAFCIDRHEWPNRPGVNPAVLMSWTEAAGMCRRAGKRLCTQDEWTFACEGEQMLPYAYGYDRNPNPCTVDHPLVVPDPEHIPDHLSPDAIREAHRLYEASPIGHNARCVSPFGVFDMIGNVDEWTINETGQPYRTSLKGGWWTTTRARCRAATLAHYEGFRYYQIGFRCCEDLPHRWVDATP